jgi:hypothetical protein
MSPCYGKLPVIGKRLAVLTMNGAPSKGRATFDRDSA